MRRLISITYLTLSVFLRHKSGEFEEYAEFIKNENNINAKNSQYYKASALHAGLC
jgi:hypothetical protein